MSTALLFCLENIFSIFHFNLIFVFASEVYFLPAANG
jgi:hypothetical protein